MEQGKPKETSRIGRYCEICETAIYVNGGSSLLVENEVEHIAK
jgi:hypothetical protein